jgi:YD repeat-containing protein
MLSAFVDSTDAALSGHVWATYDRYDSRGRLALEARPSAVAIATRADLGSIEGSNYPDLVGYDVAGSGTYQYLRPASGLIELTDYGTSTGGGDVAGYLKDHQVQQGYDGTPILLDSTQYTGHTSTGTADYPSGLTVYPVAATTSYRNTNGTGGETTSTVYTWYPGTNQVQSSTESAPVISSEQDGPGTADVTSIYYDLDGRPTWAIDADGFLHYTAYDPATGAVVKSIVDVNTALTGEFVGPAPGATPAGGGLNLVTRYQVDDQGRTTEEVSPNGKITYTVYDDPDHEVRTYPGWNPNNGTTTGPTRVTRVDYPGNYTETLTMTATPIAAGTPGNLVPTGLEGIGGVATLDRVLGDTFSSRPVEDDRYVSLGTTPYSTSMRQLGAVGTTFYATTYGYDHMGRRDRVTDAVGTTTITTYDGLGRVVDTYVGTDDSGFWGGGGSSNMVRVSEDQYDDNGVGDGDLTRETQYPDANPADDRVTQTAYDWRDRPVATKSGVQSSEDTTTHRPIVYEDLDNLGQVIAVWQYDGDVVALSSTPPAPGLLRSYATTAYDDQGRVYLQQQYSVDPSTGHVSTSALATRTYRDHRGDVIAVYAPGGQVTKDRYDGAGRVAVKSVSDGAGGTTWAAAGSLAGDHVLTETATAYDGDGDPILVKAADRDHDAPDSATGDLFSPGPAPPPTLGDPGFESPPVGAGFAYSPTGTPWTFSAGTSASFAGSDTATQGSWRGTYGAGGYDLCLDPSPGNPSIPAYASVSMPDALQVAWTTSTSDPRALQNAAGTGRLAATWYPTTPDAGSSFDIDITDGRTHRVSLYALDWDTGGARSERFDVIDAATHAVLDSRTISGFQNGE